MMERNVGGYDRIGRLVIGGVLVLGGIAGYVGFVRLAFGPFPQALTALVAVLAGIILLVTGGTQRCPINSVLGIDTCGS